jgi:hypothetical protein
MIMKDYYWYELLMDSICDKTDFGMMLGILPRLKDGNFANSKAIAVNNRLK